MLKEHSFTLLFKKFIAAGKNGKRLNKNGTRIQPQTITNYISCGKLILEYAVNLEDVLILYEVKGNNQREHILLKKYWANFYKTFTGFMYNQKACFDNYAGQNIKIIRTFFNWVNTDLGLHTGGYHKSFYVRKEEVAIHTLTIEQLQFLLFDKTFEASLSGPLQNTKDIFVFGCTVGLRYSDLVKIKQENIEYRDGAGYLKARSKKTGTDTLVKLSRQAEEILLKYKHRKGFLLPAVSLFRFNKNVKRIAELAGWVSPVLRLKSRTGMHKTGSHTIAGKMRFCDLLSSHTMRRTSITMMLTSGMPEYIVRKISGHTSDSKAFFRYVHLAQGLMDNEIEKMHTRITGAAPDFAAITC
jgi:integrase